MNKNASFRRKIIYVIILAALLYPMFLLSQPSSPGKDGQSGSPGGKLAQLRTEYGLDESELGDVDIIATSFRLFGLTPIADTILWDAANKYKMKKDWISLSATLKQLARLMPHYESVWRFQGWNLAYNVSTEFDDYRQRYHWVIEGLKFLENGVKMNKKSIRLTWDVAWHTSQKIGKSDERVQFRRLYKADDDVHGSRPIELRDCWLVGKDWYHKAEAIVDSGVPLGKISDVLFYSNAPMNQMNYSDNLEKDGRFDEKVEREWKKAQDEWTAFGNREIPTSQGQIIRLNDQEFFANQEQQLSKELEEIQPGLREEMTQQKRLKLTPQQAAAYDKDWVDRNADEINLANEAEEILRITNMELAQRMSADRIEHGIEVAQKLDNAKEQSVWTDRYRDIVNFKYWRHRAAFEQLPDVIQARKLLYEGKKAFQQGDLTVSKRDYDQAFELIKKCKDLPQFAGLDDEDAFQLDFKAVMETYMKILEQRNEKLPDDFILHDLWEKSGGDL